MNQHMEKIMNKSQKPPTKKAPVKKTVPVKAAVKRAPAPKAIIKKTAAKKMPARKAPVKKSAAPKPTDFENLKSDFARLNKTICIIEQKLQKKIIVKIDGISTDIKEYFKKNEGKKA